MDFVLWVTAFMFLADAALIILLVVMIHRRRQHYRDYHDHLTRSLTIDIGNTTGRGDGIGNTTGGGNGI